MSVSYRKRKKIVPGLSVSLSPKSTSVRLGSKHGGVSKSSTGHTTKSAGLFGFRWMKRERPNQ